VLAGFWLGEGSEPGGRGWATAPPPGAGVVSQIWRQTPVPPFDAAMARVMSSGVSSRSHWWKVPCGCFSLKLWMRAGMVSSCLRSDSLKDDDRTGRAAAASAPPLAMVDGDQLPLKTPLRTLPRSVPPRSDDLAERLVNSERLAGLRSVVYTESVYVEIVGGAPWLATLGAPGLVAAAAWSCRVGGAGVVEGGGGESQERRSAGASETWFRV